MITYAFGALPPESAEDKDYVISEIGRATRYKNALIASHRAERERYAVAKRFGIFPDTDAWIAGLREHYSGQRRAIRSACGLGWGTYLLVEQDVKAAIRSKGELSFHRYDGSGRVGAVVPTMNAKKQRVGASTAVRIGKPDSRGRTTIALRVGSPAGTRGKGRVVRLPIVLHRPLAPGRIQQAWVQVSRVGTRFVWGVRVVVEPDENQFRHRRGSGACAINFGWRTMSDGSVRVAYAVGTHGTHELRIPARHVSAWRHAESLRAIADGEAMKFLGDARRRRMGRAAGLRHPAPPVPERREGPWENSRHWALQDRHLYQWESDERASLVRRRRAFMLAWAQLLAGIYDRVSIEDYSLTRLIARGDGMNIQEARHMRFISAPGELREMVKRCFGADRVDVRSVKARTMLCHVCGEVMTGDRVRSLHLYCERCGGERDQDANNAENLLADEAAE